MTAENARGVFSDDERKLHVVGPEDFREIKKHYLDVEPGERVLFGGSHELGVVPYKKMFVFPQIRPGLSPIRETLADDIEANDLGSFPDVARLDEVALKNYASYVNKAWDSKIDVADYHDMQAEDGYYYLVIAGHTRFAAIGDVIKKRKIQNADVMAKIHRDLAPHEIVQIQLGENIHKEPPKERQAIALVETYLFGIEDGLWANKTEFIQSQNGKISRKALNAALNFANLPEDVRFMVFKGKIPYSAAIELGRYDTVIREFVALSYFGGDFDALEAEVGQVQRLVHIKMHNIAVSIENKKLNGPAAVKHVQGHITDYEAQIERKKNDQEPLELELVSAASQLQAHIKEEMKLLQQGLQELARQPVAKRVELLALHAHFGRDYLPETFYADLDADLQSYLRQVGKVATETTLEF